MYNIAYFIYTYFNQIATGLSIALASSVFGMYVMYFTENYTNAHILMPIVCLLFAAIGVVIDLVDEIEKLEKEDNHEIES